jgi:large subunit ribosomal protein L13
MSSSNTKTDIKFNKTKFAQSDLTKRKWFLIDAKGKNLGRLSVEIAKILRGKRNPQYTPNSDQGDYVVVVNAGQIVYTGKNKGQQNIYYRNTGYPGGLRQENIEQLLKRIPERVIYNTVKGMIPRDTTLGRAQLKKLKVYASADHPHAAQQLVEIKELPAI